MQLDKKICVNNKYTALNNLMALNFQKWEIGKRESS